MAIDFTSDLGKVRLLVNDVNEPDFVFSDDEITAFLDLESGNVKRAAAQAIDTIADNEALASKVIDTQDLKVDGAKLADALRKRAAALRAQADKAQSESDDDAFFEVIPLNGQVVSGPELTTWPGF